MVNLKAKPFNLTDEDIRSPKYAYRLLFTPLSANRKGQADQVIEFVKAGTEGSEQLNKAYTYIKETEKKKYRAKEIVEFMKEKGYTWFTINKMTDFWKYELGNRDGYGVFVTPEQWLWYENWIPVVEDYCKRIAPTIKLNSIKEGYYASEIVTLMLQQGYTFTSLWKDKLHIDKDNTEYGYEMPNKRYVWKESFIPLVEKYCKDHRDELIGFEE